MNDNRIPTIGEHRGVALHEGQSESRLVTVRRDIDAAHDLADLAELVAFADDPANAPEARLLARAKALATLDEAVDQRAPRQRGAQLSRERIRASAAGCDSITWQSPTHYGSILDVPPSPGNPGPALRGGEHWASRPSPLDTGDGQRFCKTETILDGLK